LHLMMGSIRFFVVGCYIPPNDLEALVCVDKAWCECPAGAHPNLIGDLNVNPRAPSTEREEMIAKQVDAMDLVDMSRTLGEKTPREVDVADEKGGDMDLLSVRLLFRKGTRP
jgi:hypothetical protein